MATQTSAAKIEELIQNIETASNLDYQMVTLELLNVTIDTSNLIFSDQDINKKAELIADSRYDDQVQVEQYYCNNQEATSYETWSTLEKWDDQVRFIDSNALFLYTGDDWNVTLAKSEKPLEARAIFHGACFALRTDPYSCINAVCRATRGQYKKCTVQTRWAMVTANYTGTLRYVQKTKPDKFVPQKGVYTTRGYFGIRMIEEIIIEESNKTALPLY